MGRDQFAGIQVSGVSKTYRRKQVLHDVSFSVPPGTITGLLGPNGSGKSTAMRIMLGLSIADAGSTTFDGAHYRDLPWPGRAVGSLLDPTAHHPGRSVYDTLASATIRAGARLSRVDELIGILGLTSASRRRFGALSLGMKQRVALALALVGRPRHLILDEPMNGLDVETGEWLRDTLVQHAYASGGSVLVSTHLLAELQTFAHHIVVLSAGSVRFAGDLEHLRPRIGSAVVAVEPARLNRALQSRGIAFDMDVRTRRFSVEASSRTLSEICTSEGIVIEELTGDRESISDAYRRLTQGEYRAEGNAFDVR